MRVDRVCEVRVLKRGGVDRCMLIGCGNSVCISGVDRTRVLRGCVVIRCVLACIDRIFIRGFDRMIDQLTHLESGSHCPQMRPSHLLGNHFTQLVQLQEKREGRRREGGKRVTVRLTRIGLTRVELDKIGL